VIDPVKTPGSTLLYLFLPPLRGSVGGDCFPTTHGIMETSNKKKHLKRRDCVVQRYLLSVAEEWGWQFW
jgi:hypothetical protein